MKRTYPTNPLIQTVKGVFVFQGEDDEALNEAHELLKNMRCQVISAKENRITVTSSRGNLQSIKASWLAGNAEGTLSNELSRQVSQIIIGGNVN